MRRAIGAVLVLAIWTGAVPANPAAEQAFEQHVRPVLIEHCQTCHGPKKQMGGLRVDSRQALLQGGDSGPALKPGDAEGSLVIQAIRHKGDLKMPKKPLPAPLVETLAAWVQAGAPWPAARSASSEADAWKRHWAFQPLRRPAPPVVKQTVRARNPIDTFLLARLQAKGLSLSPEADRPTLLRRLSFDLTGLPPTPQEIDAFLADTRPAAYERQVDRLLASPRHGERQARHWLDVARYADTKGYVFFEEANYPWGYTYRDYLIEAFNQDRPYDRMIREQLAADLLPGGDRRALRALGFVTLGGRFMNNVHDILDDRIDAVTRGFLGLTVACARCHDHKYDPLTAADYYALYSVFASSAEPTVPPLYEEPPATPVYVRFVAELNKREQALQEFRAKKLDDLRGSAQTRVSEYLLAAHARRGKPRADEFMLIADGNDLNPSMITRWFAYLERTARAPDPVWAPWHAFAALPEQTFAASAADLTRRFTTGQDAALRLNPLVVRRVVATPPASLAELAKRYAELLNAVEKRWHEALAVADRTKQPRPTRLADAAEEQLRRAFHDADAPPNLAPGLFSDLELLPDRASQGTLQNLRKQVEQWRATGPGAPPRAMALTDEATVYQPVVFRRGNPSNLGPRVPRELPGVLTGGSRLPLTRGSGRLELAEAIADPKHPLTARVRVNRVWMHLTGQPLVETPGDFGLRATPPTHPELLDWLADDFVRSGWSLKHLHRLIVGSAAYRQASSDRPAARAVDADNRLFWRMNRRRLDFESTRDALLSAAGQLDGRIGGPSEQNALAPGVRRRTLYAWIDRLHVPELFRSFDFPGPDASSPRRDSTMVPQQALFLMNSDFALHAARSLAARPDLAAPLAAERMTTVYRICFGRIPDADELRLGRTFLDAGGTASAGWQRYVQALLLSNEFQFID